MLERTAAVIRGDEITNIAAKEPGKFIGTTRDLEARDAETRGDWRVRQKCTRGNEKSTLYFPKRKIVSDNEMQIIATGCDFAIVVLCEEDPLRCDSV